MTDPERNETARVEAFSDGVFAIAITLLIIEIKVPHIERGQLAQALGELWPSYAAFITSFVTIGIMWLNHHRLFTLIQRPDNVLILLNTLLLMGISFVPFPTAVLAEYFATPDGREAAAFYSLVFFLTAIVFNVLWRYASWREQLLYASVDRVEVRALTKQYRFGPVLYLAALGLAWLNVYASILLNLLLAMFFAVPPKRVLWNA